MLRFWNKGWGLIIFLVLAGCAHQPDRARLADARGVPDAPPTPAAEAPASGTPAHASEAANDEAEALRATADALAKLRAGNADFVGEAEFSARRSELTTGQHPFAAIVCCSDSRVPPEHVFHQGLGELFIVRVAGNVVSPEVAGSIEYAVEHLHAPLVVVLGHEKCGAVKATVEGGEAPGSIGSLVARIAPSVQRARALGTQDADALLNSAIDLNIDAMVGALKRGPIISEALEAGHVKVVGAKYHLASGKVSWRE